MSVNTYRKFPIAVSYDRDNPVFVVGYPQELQELSLDQ